MSENTHHEQSHNTLAQESLSHEHSAHHHSASEQEQDVAPRSFVQRKNKRLLVVALPLGFLVLLIAVLVSILFSTQTYFAERIYPNITIRGVAVSEQTPDETEEALRAHYAPFLEQPLTITYGDQVWTPSLHELGVQVDFDTAIHQAMGIGHQGGFFDDMKILIAVWLQGREIPLPLVIDEHTLQQYLKSIARDVDQPAIDASLRLVAQHSETEVSIPGRQIKINEMIQDMVAALQTMQPQHVPVRTRLLMPLLDDVDAQHAQRLITTMVQAPLTLNAQDQSWEWSVEDLARMVRIHRTPKANGVGDDLAVTLDPFLVRKRIHEIADATATGRVYPRLAWNGGDLTIIQPGEPGIRVDEAKAEQAILDAVSTSNRQVEIPFRTADPLVTEDTLDELGIVDLLGVGKSDFSGSEDYRITNIIAGMNLLHGMLIAPGEEFSFNRAIGAINADNGFVEGYAIVQDRTQLEWGGGICQDSTTLFRAVFWAGLPITERWGHLFYISWYDQYGYGPYGNGPGMDATIFTGGPDLKFVNDTGHWLLLQTHVDTSIALAEIAIYGTSDGRVVSLEGPEIENWKPAPDEPVYIANPDIPPGSRYHSDSARGGMDVSFVRIIERDGKEIQRSEFVTKFKPWPNIYEVNPADLGPDGKPWPTPTPTPDETQLFALTPLAGEPYPQPQPAPDVGGQDMPAPTPVPAPPAPEPLPVVPPEAPPVPEELPTPEIPVAPDG